MITKLNVQYNKSYKVDEYFTYGDWFVWKGITHVIAQVDCKGYKVLQLETLNRHNDEFIPIDISGRISKSRLADYLKCSEIDIERVKSANIQLET